MKIKLAVIISGWIALLLSVDLACAQAPSSIAGDGFLAGVLSGVYPLASYGYYIFIPANSGNTYQTIGIYNVNNSSGTYTYAPTSASTATMNINDSSGGTGVLNASFTSASLGSYYEYLSAYPSINQSGNFGFSSVNAPSSLAGRTINFSVVNGASPFLRSGSYTITIANSGNTYTVSTGQSGTYSYSTLNRSTGMVQLNDSVTGVTTAYFGFSSATGGGFAIKASSGTGYQVGNFVLLDTTPPTVTISSPTIGEIFNTSSVEISGTANDPGSPSTGVSQVQVQVNGTGGTWQTASGTTSWSASVALRSGANTIYVRSQDRAGNYSIISSVSVTYTTDKAGPMLTISSPANNATVTSADVSVSGTASDNGNGNNGVSSVTVNSSAANNDTVSGSGTANWSATVALHSGQNIITVVAEDDLNNQTSQQRIVTYNPPRPVLGGLSINGSLLETTVSGLSVGETIVMESSTDLKHWTTNQTKVATGSMVTITPAINPSLTSLYFRVQVQ